MITYNPPTQLLIYENLRTLFICGGWFVNTVIFRTDLQELTPNLAKRPVDPNYRKRLCKYPQHTHDVELLMKELLKIGIDSVVKIDNTPEDGAAYEAGLKSGDVIVSVGGEKVIGTLDIVKQLWYNDIGDTLKVKVYRDGEFMTFDVVLKEFKFATKGK